ncbi:MAG: hypothetical protein ACJAYU_001260, partial [Bradymonadia bacterium]
TEVVAGVATLQTADDFARLVGRLGRSSERIDARHLDDFPTDLMDSFVRAQRLDPRGRSCWWVVEADELSDTLSRRLERFVAKQTRRCVSGTAVVVGISGTKLGLWVAVQSEPGVRVWRGKATSLDARAAEVWGALLTGREPALAAITAHRLMSKRELTRAFFRDIRKALGEVSSSWSGLAVETDEVRSALSVTLLCRLMFLYFVQEKGWLDGDRGYVAATVLDPDAEDVLRSRLWPLFFDALSKAPEDRSSPWSGIPFLNGGLFDRTDLESANPEATLTDESLRNLVGDVLERYRFVGTEEGDLAAIDPVMLGTVFEELMGAEQRGASGTFYTPPRLVAECVQDAIIPLLEARVGSERLARIRDGSQRLSGKEKAEVADALLNLRILDPAMGSGAFLLGAMHYLVKFLGRVCDHEPGDLVRQVIANNLYGVDISSSAVTITELRLWLALVARMPDDLAPAEPLPNLGHHIRCGNTLFGPSVVAQLDGLELDPTLVSELAAATQAYSGAHGADKVEADRTRRSLERRLTIEFMEAARDRSRQTIRDFDLARGQDLFGNVRALSVAERRKHKGLLAAAEQAEGAVGAAERGELAASFDFNVAFADVVKRGGFDLVVGNPPWVRLSNVPPPERRRLQSVYRWMRCESGSSFGVQPDLCVAFVEKSVRLLRPGGVLSLVVPGKLFTAGYGAGFRAGMRRDTTLLRLRDLATGEVVHFSADTFPAVIVARKGAEPRIAIRVDDGAGRSGVADVGDVAVDDVPGSPWPLLDSKSMEAYRVLSCSAPALKEQFVIRLGIKTGANSVFVDPPDGIGPVVRAVRGADIEPMRVAPSSTLLFAHGRESGLCHASIAAGTAEYLEEHRARLERRADAKDSDPLWKVHRVYPESLGHRVVWRDIGQRLDAVYVPPVWEGGPAVLNSAYVVGVASSRQGIRLAAWLCSTPVRFTAAVSAERALGGYRRFMARNVGRVPVPDSVVHGSPELDEVARLLHSDPADSRAWRRLHAFACSVLGLDMSQRDAIGDHAERLSLSVDRRTLW